MMAANSNSFIRVRLLFDYAPPAVIGCRMCWLLVDLNSCRVVADLESNIREKFEFSRGSILNLFIDDCYLPHTESIFVVRDNDSVRVKVDTVSNPTKHCSPEALSENGRKRQRSAEENGSGESGLKLECEKKKRKKSIGESTKLNSLQTAVEETKKKHKEKKKKKQKDEEKGESGLPAPPKPSLSVKKTPNRVAQVVKCTKKPQVSTQNTSSSDSSSSEDEETVKKAPAPKPVTKTPTTTPAASKTLTNGRPSKKLPPPTSSSSSSDTDSSSSEENTAAKTTKAISTTVQEKTQQEMSTANGVLIAKAVKAVNESVSDEEIQLVIKKPMQQPQGRIMVGQPSWQPGRGRGKARQPPRDWSKGRGRGQCVEYSYNGDQKPSYSTDSLTNVSVVIQNGEESTPKPDYSSMPLLAAPPQVGQKIAFKLLELTENYTPEVSEYKEAKIVSFDPATKQIELNLLTASQAPVEPGKFDLVYQNADGSESVEYAVDRSSWVTERWDSLLEPRLII